MAIDGRVSAVTLNKDGTATLSLEPREKATCAGQTKLTIVNPPEVDFRTFANAMIGQELWGGAGEIMVRETKWADRIGYTRIRLIDQ